MDNLDRQRRKERVAQIATQLVEGQVRAGKLDAGDDAAMERAIKQAVSDAAAAYDAAEEFVSG